MPDLKIREEKIKEKRMTTSWRDFLMEICSRSGLTLYRNNGVISKYPPVRINNLLVDENADIQYEDYAREYNFDISFFENFNKLLQSTPLQPLIRFSNNENAEYVDAGFGVKNGYLSFVTGLSAENIFYSGYVYDDTRNVYNALGCYQHVENAYATYFITNSQNVFYSKNIHNSFNIWFCSNLIGCQECLVCNGLENKKYCINNIQYAKEEYMLKKSELLHNKSLYAKMHNVVIETNSINYTSKDVSGACIVESNDIDNGYLMSHINKGKNIVIAHGTDGCNNFFDCFDGGMSSHNFYGANGVGTNCEKIFNSTQIGNSYELYYCYHTRRSSHCLGCVGLRNKEFCILNKQYPQEERYIKANEIFAQMEKDGTLGQFFPGWMNPFYFNDTVAFLIDDSFTKEEVIKAGYLWRDDEIKVDVPAGAEVIETKGLNQYQGYNEKGERKINPEILKKVIKDDKGNYYRIVPMELEFLQKHGLPLPEIHWLERIKLGFKFK